MRLLPLAALILIAATVAAQAPPTVTFTTITDFGEGDGQYPNSPLAQGTDGDFYGTTYYGPRSTDFLYGFGFYLTPAGAFTLLDYASDTNFVGSKASAGFALAGDGNFYSTTAYGGTGKFRDVNHAGTIVKLDPEGVLSTVYSFCSLRACQDGDDPYSTITPGSDGNLYGTTSIGGLHDKGVAFVNTLTGKHNTLHNFCAQANCADGAAPGPLLQATDGNFYGVASGGTGADCYTPGSCGMIFKMTPQGVTTAFYNFCSQSNCADGSQPATILQAADGAFYGMTQSGGTYATNNYSGSGTIFKLTLQGALTTLYSFCNVDGCQYGTNPGGMLQANDGNFYGTVADGQGSACYFAYGCGIVFELTSTGTFSTLYTFCEQAGEFCADGIFPGALTQGTNGNFYGTTERGGPSGYGTAFTLSAGLAPFIETVTSSGAVGSSVIILGTNLTGSTSVSFNGQTAAFTVVSASEIIATVPKNASTGQIVVTTPGEVLSSNKNFNIAP